MIDDTLGKRAQLQLIYNQPLRLVKDGKSRVPGSAKAKKFDTMKVPSTQPSSSRPERAPDPQIRYQHYNVPSSSTSARGGTAEMPVPRKRPSDASSIPMKKRQKTDKYPGCAICGGPHHLVKDCPITAEGPKRYCPAISDFISSLLMISWVVYTLRSPD